jgi:hypothetical protein
VDCPFTNCAERKVSGVIYVEHVAMQHNVGILETSIYRVRTDFARVEDARHFSGTNVNGMEIFAPFFIKKTCLTAAHDQKRLTLVACSMKLSFLLSFLYISMAARALSFA